MKIFTIGFTQKSAEQFFTLLQRNGVTCVVDIRLGVTSQLAAFAKGEDLKYFLKSICNISYVHDLAFAPTESLLKSYKNKKISWQEYEKTFGEIMQSRNIVDHIKTHYSGKSDFCLLCSEPTPENCHRRLVANIFKEIYPNAEIIHL